MRQIWLFEVLTMFCVSLLPLKGGYGRWGRDRYGPPIRTDYRLIVENLSSRCSWQDLKVCGGRLAVLSGGSFAVPSVSICFLL